MSSECFTSQKSLYFTEEEIACAWEHPIPRHVSIIMDGNRRWVKKQPLAKITNPHEGHWAGARVLTTIVEAASDLGIKVLTVFAFSTENWFRSPLEVNTLLQIFESYLNEQREKMIEQGVRFNVIGDLSPFSPSLKYAIDTTRAATQGGKGIELVVGLNYGGRDEMRRAVQKIADDVCKGTVKQEEIDEALISQYLDTAPFGDPDLLIRTSGEKRISNFLLWQLAYTEVFITETLWPDFTPRDLFAAVIAFQKRTRRKGK